MSHDYVALTEIWCEQAKRCLSEARRSNNLRDIVRLVAMAATLERRATRLSSKTAARLTDLTRIVQEGSGLCADAQRMFQRLPSTQVCPEEFSVLSQSDINALGSRSGPLVNLPKGDIGARISNTKSVDPFFRQHGAKL